MAIRVSSVLFFRYLASQSTTRVAKVREAKKMMMTPRDEYKRIDYWLQLRESVVRLLTGEYTSREFNAAIDKVSDGKKVDNYRAAAIGVQKWIGRKTVKAKSAQSRLWTSSGLQVAVTPELILSLGNSPDYVVKLYFSAEPISKYLANPMLRLLEVTHGDSGEAALLDAQRGKLYTGPTSRPQDLDVLLTTEAASFVSIWNQV